MKSLKLFRSSLLAFAIALAGSCLTAPAADKEIVLVAGHPSHGPGEHEFRAGCLVLQKCLNQVPGIHATVYTNGWPNEKGAFDHAAAVLFFMDGGSGHPVAQADHLQIVAALARKGVGIGCAHYGVEIPLNHGGTNFLDWIGGFYEDGFSINPVWVADLKVTGDHPIARGVKPFKLRDEWYFNIHFREGMRGITPILTATPDAETRQGRSASPRGPFPRIVNAAGREEVLMWAVENPGANRGFGFTGGHFNQNWGEENFRKVVLNGLLWIAHAEVPKNGVESSVTAAELTQNLDPKGRR
jgi:type 1 glutamine amidotransferase